MARKDTSKQLDDIEVEVKEHTKILASVDKTLALQAQQLESHMRRTQLAEENIAMLRQEFKPIQDQAKFLRGLTKLAVWIATIGAALGGIATFVFYLLRALGKI